MPMCLAIWTTGSPPTKPLLMPNPCNMRSPGRKPLAYRARAPSSLQIVMSDSVRPTYDGLPVVPDDAWIGTISDIGATTCEPSGGCSARLSRSSCFSVKGRSARWSSVVTRSMFTECSANFAR